MEHTDKIYCLEVWGPLACFTRPELKVERVSYDVITPSAARAIFEAIFWKPAIRWEVVKIEVLNPIRWIAVRRNEVGAAASPRTRCIYIEDKRQQKNAMMLRDVRYRLHARQVFIPVGERREEHRQPSADENPGKYNAMFERRAAKGQCFTQPYLGTRECSAAFRLVGDGETDLPAPIDESKDLGLMLYDMDFTAAHSPEAMFYQAKMEHGVIAVPSLNSQDLLR